MRGGTVMWNFHGGGDTPPPLSSFPSLRTSFHTLEFLRNTKRWSEWLKYTNQNLVLVLSDYINSSNNIIIVESISA